MTNRMFCAVLGLLSAQSVACATTPLLFDEPNYQSPVRAAGDDLLLLPGINLSATDTVVYQALTDTRVLPAPPSPIPTTSTAASGVGDIASAAEAPYALTVRLPVELQADRSYVLWVRNAAGEWSNGVRINDARPLWITPDFTYATATVAGLPRTLKVVGRNLQPDANGVTQVRLIGAQTYVLPAHTVATHPLDTSAELQRHVAAADLPPVLALGEYSVEVSRDGTSWIALSGYARGPPQNFNVLPDPVPARQFTVSDPLYGIGSDFRFNRPGTPCAPDDGQEDTPCILNALYAARLAGGGTLQFGPGAWHALTRASGTFSGVTGDGIEVPPKVNLEGAGAQATTIVRGASWPKMFPTFSLQGANSVRGITFHDAAVYQADDRALAMLSIGQKWYWAGSPRPRVSHTVITENVFDKPFNAIGSGNLPTDHLFITHNTFGGAFETGIVLNGDANDTLDRYELRDSVIAYNTFYPSSFIDVARGQGSLASHIASGTRVDFSNNIADGSSTRYFYDPAHDRPGFRGAWFWSAGVNQEMVLVSRNAALCSGDKVGDGEAIVFDSDNDREGFPIAQPVIDAAPWIDPAGIAGSTVIVRGTVIDTRSIHGSSQPIENLSDYYSGWWLRIVQGAGLGQWRKVHSLSVGSNDSGATVTVHVTPALDVLPGAGSLALMGRGNWHTAIVDNFIDQRQPQCTKNNATKPQGGTLSWYSSTADSVMAGNRMLDTSGILIAHQYELYDPLAHPFPFGSMVQSSNEVRDNLIDGEYDWSKPASPSGIFLGYAATPNTEPPPVLGFGIAIAHNAIIRADTSSTSVSGAPVGGIALGPSWHTGPPNEAGITPWQLGTSTLVFHNALSSLNGGGLDRLAIGLDASFPARPIAWRTVLFANACNDVQQAFQDNGTESVRYCPADVASCECSGAALR